MENNKTPQIRFAGFSNEWKEKQLSEIVERVKSYSLSRDVETKEYTGYKYIHYGDIHTKVADIINKNTKLPNIKSGDYELLQENDVIVADASEDYQGIATPAVVAYTPEFRLVSGLHTIALRPKETNSFFLYYILNSKAFKKYGYKVGTGMKIFGISSTNLMEFKYRYPSFDEQTKIGNFFKQLDDIIFLHQRELDNLKQMKQGFLKKMFPKEGESVPELRFPEFKGEWEQQRLGNVAEFINGRAYKQDELLDYGKYKVLRVGNFYTNNSWYFSDLELDEKYYAINGDLLYAWSATFGPHIWEGEKVVYHYHIWKIELSKKLTKAFTMQLLENDKQNIIKNKNGSTMLHITKSDMEEKYICLPSTEEQVQIGEFFKHLDALINLHQQELDLLKQTKKAFLQKMFI